MNNLANNYVDQGRTTEAVAMQQRVLAINEKVAGPDSPDVARALSNLANSYKELGRPAEAVPLYERALRIFSQKFGEDLGLVADVYGALGVWSSTPGSSRTPAEISPGPSRFMSGSSGRSILP